MKALVISRDALPQLIGSLARQGYAVVGPTLRNGAIVLDALGSADELPAGWTDEQRPAHYRLRRRDDAAVFGHTVGPHAWKQFLFPPVAHVWRVRRDHGQLAVEPDADPPPRYALFGVRPCELRAIRIQDRVFLNGACPDPAYRARRDRALIVVANCGEAGGTCFCASMGTGPRATGEFDLALTEIVAPGRHEFVIEVGSERGDAVLDGVEAREARPADLDAAVQVSARAATTMGRALDTDGLRDVLVGHLDHPRWDHVAARCLACGNCTLVCPTCFCSTVEDTTDFSGAVSSRHRRWDSCFSQDFTYIHGGSVRSSIRSRYRQWLTHKLATWVDQFGTFGCVGCGRCITWCPAGIDLTEEASAIRASDEDAASAGAGAPADRATRGAARGDGVPASDALGGVQGPPPIQVGGRHEDD